MRKPLLLVVLLLVPVSLLAQPWRDRPARDRYYGPRLEDKFELTPFLGYTWGGTIYAGQSSVFNQDVTAASTANVGVSFAVPLRQGFKLELEAAHQGTHLTTGGGLFEPDNRVANMDINYYQAGFQIPFETGRGVYPFIIATGGVATLSPDIRGVSSATRFAASIGGGVKVPVNPNMGVRFDIRAYVTQLPNNCSGCYYNYNDTFYQGQANVGVFFSF